MTAVPATPSPDISPEFVARLAERAQEAEELRRLPSATVNDFVASGFAEVPVPARYGGVQAPWPSISIRSVGWRTDARPAPGPWASSS